MVVLALGSVSAAMRQGRYKLLVGPPQGEWQASWYGLFSPNATTPVVNQDFYACRCESEWRGRLAYGTGMCTPSP